MEIQQWKKALIVEIPAGFEAWRERKTENEQLTESSSMDVDDEKTSDMEEVYFFLHLSTKGLCLCFLFYALLFYQTILQNIVISF